MRAKPPTGSDNRLLRPTAFAQSRHVAVIRGQFGIRSTANAWWGWEDSNFQPNDYQPLELNH